MPLSFKHSYAYLLSRLPRLRRLSVPYFLSDDLLPEWHAGQSEHVTQTTFYYPPPAELASAVQATAPPTPDGAPPPPVTIPIDGLVPSHIYFPAIREACEILRQSCPELEHVSWCAPSACYDPQVAVIGPFALKIVSWQYEPPSNTRQRTAEEEMEDDSVLDPDEVIQHGLWVVTERHASNDFDTQ